VAKVAIVATSSSHGLMFLVKCNSDGLSINDDQHFVLRNISESNLSQNDNYPLQASLYFLVPGVGHALRINGVIKQINHQYFSFNITQVYFHCARAAARADLWGYREHHSIRPDNLISNASYLLLKTKNSDGKVEISPRGDEIGFVKQISQTTLLIPERPGNKIAVSLRNIISCSEVELFFLTPGINQTLNVKGVAKVISACNLLEQCAVNEKIPKTGILISVKSSQFQLDPVLESEKIWESEKMIDKAAITPFSKALSAHINGTGFLGKATATIVGAVVKHDMKNLY
jgi:predicted pyridoxine 5'-phosphate oxidase superfamily flavin-nucleotide-binding protein